MPLQGNIDALDLLTDPSAKLVINDVGNGWQHHWFTAKHHLLDMDLKLNEEFTFYHPILREDVWVSSPVAALHRHLLMILFYFWAISLFQQTNNAY
jgi:hypothetical protein